MPDDLFTEPIAEQVWKAKYRFSEDGHAREPDVQATWSRVALALSHPEIHHRNEWRDRFETALHRFRFLPGGRILAGAGTSRHATLFNCFVAGQLHDSIDGIFSSLAEAMITMQAGGGIGCDFSALRPAGQAVSGSRSVASGPVSFMQVWDKACEVLASTGIRRGAMMATLRCDHPDIEQFIQAKREPGALCHFNLSVLVSDAFMHAVEDDDEWPLMFPLDGRGAPEGARIHDRIWPGSSEARPCLVMRTVKARELWEQLQKAAFEYGDPGVIFIDRVQRDNNLYYTETISATNPCGEVPLPAHGACNLGSINLTQFVKDSFGKHATLDLQAVEGVTGIAVRMLDNAYEISHFPLKAQEKAARATRRLGIGITGLADALAMLGVRYGSESSFEIADEIMETICHAAYRASIDLAHERGAFPEYLSEKYAEGVFIRSLPAELVDGIRRNGIRNSHLTAIAPAGSISLLANNVSSGIEPIYALDAWRSIRAAEGIVRRAFARDYAWHLYCQRFGENMPPPPGFVESGDIDPVDQLKMQAAVQAHVDQSISKTINLAAGARYSDYRNLFRQAYELGVKGCTIFRPSPKRERVLTPGGHATADHLCP